MYDHARLFDRLRQASTTDPAASLLVVSRRMGVHPHTLARVVRERTGASFSAWRAHHRASAACRLLRTRPELSIKEVAVAAGFSATSVFDRFLRRACGRSPSECRAAAAREFDAWSMPPCADRLLPAAHATGAHGAKVNVLVRVSTIEGDHGVPPGGTLEVVSRVIPPRRPAPRRDLDVAHQAAGGSDVEGAGEAIGGCVRTGAGDRGAVTRG